MPEGFKGREREREHPGPCLSVFMQENVAELVFFDSRAHGVYIHNLNIYIYNKYKSYFSAFYTIQINMHTYFEKLFGSIETRIISTFVQ